MRYLDGVPYEVADLSPNPALNNPFDSETRDLCVLLAHIRALSAFIAQQEQRIKALEERMAVK